MRRRLTVLACAAPLLCAVPTPSLGQQLTNSAFQIQYDVNGIRSLKRTNDVHDTDYIAANGRLGRLMIRYRTTRNGDWRELHEMLLRQGTPSSVSFEFGRLRPTLAQRASPIAERGVGGLRALSDGLLPAPRETSGRGAPPRTGQPPPEVPSFSWTVGANEPGAGGTGAVGVTRWVQYVFASPEQVSRTQVFWNAPPRSWRLLYLDAGEWKEVQATGAYTVAPSALAAVEFAPVKTIALRLEATLEGRGPVSLSEWAVGPDPELEPPGDLNVVQTFDLNGDALEWTIRLANRTTRPIEVADLAVPLAFAERAGARGEIYTKKLMRHALVSGHGSWVYWQRSNGVGPYLLMTPAGATKLEYFDSSGGLPGAFGTYTPYIHAQLASARATAAGGDWRLPISNLEIAPNGIVTYSFRFQWVKDVAGVRDALFRENKFDTAIVPGMVVPSDLPALIALRTSNRIETIEPEHPSTTAIRFVGDRNGNTRIYEVKFAKLGENMLTVRYGEGRWATLEFFVTEPLETVIKKRASFLVERHQHRDPAKWYYGVYSDWDQKNEILRSPEDRDSLSAWLTDANDDAGNARPAFIASKNVFFPDQTEINSLELYIGKYLWGGMQMTDSERHPYALYGIPNFMANRSSPDPGRNGQSHVWRIYDYPHIIMLYYRMHHIAKFYPDKVKYLNADQYLERAYRTAIAYWTVPLAVEKWSADAVGTMNEAFIPELIRTLEDEGKKDWAATLRAHWEGKVDRFVNRTPNLYGSEFAFDSTGFESTGAFAKYAVTRDDPAFRSKVTVEAARKFMDFQLLLNMTDRGWLETTYYQLGSDYRGNLTYLLSYMSQLGGWSILDYGLHFAADPTDYLRLGYASSLSSWALVNSGTAESGFGYWFPSPNNDGATGGGFMPEASGRAWIGKTMRRGAWYYSAEEDVGYCGALRTHATIVARDPVFGEIAYGGLLERQGNSISVIPRDGLRVRFHVIRGTTRLHMILDRDGYAREKAISVSDDLSRIEFTIENRAGAPHQATLTVSGLAPGRYDVRVGNTSAGAFTASGGEQRLTLPVGSSPETAVRIVRL